MTGITKFQSHCEKLAKKITAEKLSEFEKLQDDLSRIRYMYPVSTEIKVAMSNWSPKDFERANTLKASGNKLFQNKNYSIAIHVYNEALLRCPQDCIEGQKLHDVLIGNRSAVFFELKEYEKVLRDIEVLKVYGHHPTPYKLFIRAGKSCEAVKKYSSALNYYSTALQALRSQEINENDRRKVLPDVETRIKYLQTKNFKDVNGKTIDKVDIDVKNLTYPALSSKVVVKSSPKFGRYVVAKEAIKSGEIIGVEEPYVSVLNGDTYRTNCAKCLISTNQPIVCEYCSQACFCSFACKESAIFHKTECRILLTLFDTGASLNCLMAFRMVTQKPLKKHLEESDELKKEKNIVIYKTHDYYNVNNLVSHSDKRNPTEFMHYTFMSTYLLQLLKMTDYFDKTDEKILTDAEAYIGSLILKNLQILQFNAHEISELQIEKGNCKSTTVGAGLYTTLALFNHSCDPSLIRYNIGNVMVLKAVKPIKPNEGIYENYGPFFTNTAKEERNKKLKETYWFDCECQPCLEDWPMFKDIETDDFPIACECGAIIQTSTSTNMLTVTCPMCHKDKNLLRILKLLMPLEAKSKEVEDLFNKASYKACMDLIVDMLDCYFKYLVPPIQDVIHLQQRLKDCIHHLGHNKHFDYKVIVNDAGVENRMMKMMSL